MSSHMATQRPCTRSILTLRSMPEPLWAPHGDKLGVGIAAGSAVLGFVLPLPVWQLCSSVACKFAVWTPGCTHRVDAVMVVHACAKSFSSSPGTVTFLFGLSIVYRLSNFQSPLSVSACCFSSEVNLRVVHIALSSLKDAVLRVTCLKCVAGSHALIVIPLLFHVHFPPMCRT